MPAAIALLTKARRVGLFTGLLRSWNSGLPSACASGLHLHRLHEVLAQRRDLLRLHQTFLQPKAIVHRKRLVSVDRILEVRAESAKLPFAKPGLLGVARVVEVGGRVALAAEDERHGIPRQVDRPLARSGIPVARLAGFADAVGADVDRFPAGQGIDVVVGAELKTGVLRVAVESNATCQGPHARGELDQLPAGDAVRA